MSSRARTAPPTAFLNFRVAHGRYYGRIFPAELMCKWLGYGTQNEKSAADNLLCRREFSFTIAEDVYIRYLSYENADALRKVRPNPNAHPKEVPVIVPRRKHHDAFCAQGLCDQLPHKIDIGAVFTADPRDHKKFKLFEPVQREFLIDIDLTDYEFLDCDVKKIETCDRCWPIMALAARALNQILVKDFGFEHLLFVYSGRRGIHCWVCDTRARVMSNDVRSAVADYLSPKLNAATGRLSIAQPMHPSLLRSMAEVPPLAVPEVGPLASSVPAWQLWPASKPRLQTPPPNPASKAAPCPSHGLRPFRRRAYDDLLEPFFKETILGCESEGGFGELDKEAGQVRLLDMLGDDDVKARFLESWRRGAGAAQVTPPAPSLHPACTQPAPAAPAPAHTATPQPAGPAPADPPPTDPQRPSPPPAGPTCTRAGPSSSAAVAPRLPPPRLPPPRLCAEWAGEVEQPGQARARQEEPRALERARRDHLQLHLPAA